MQKKRLFVVLSGAVVFGLFAAVSVSRFLANAQSLNKDMATVMVAKVDVPLGTKIIAEHLTPVQFPRDATPDGTFDNASKVIGRIAVTNIAAREPVTDFKLAADGATAGLSAVIPEGYRAMTVKVDDVVGISGFIRPGALVDVVVVIDPSDKMLGQGPVSKIVLQNIKVLANGQNIDRPKNEREAESVKAVTLQVTPEQAEKLALAATEGKLQLVMRNSVDQGDEQTPGVDKRSLLTGERAQPAPEAGSLKSERPKVSAPPAVSRSIRPSFMREESSRSVAQNNSAPAPAPAPRESVEVIEGSKKSNVSFR